MGSWVWKHCYVTCPQPFISQRPTRRSKDAHRLDQSPKVRERQRLGQTSADETMPRTDAGQHFCSWLTGECSEQGGREGEKKEKDWLILDERAPFWKAQVLKALMVAVSAGKGTHKEWRQSQSQPCSCFPGCLKVTHRSDCRPSRQPPTRLTDYFFIFVVPGMKSKASLTGYTSTPSLYHSYFSNLDLSVRVRTHTCVQVSAWARAESRDRPLCGSSDAVSLGFGQEPVTHCTVRLMLSAGVTNRCCQFFSFLFDNLRRLKTTTIAKSGRVVSPAFSKLQSRSTIPPHQSKQNKYTSRDFYV